MYILIALPIAIFIYMLVINFTYISLLFTTTIGRVMLIACVGLLIVGFAWMKRVVKIDV